MRASRLLSLLLLLQARGGLTAAQIATELEVSVRTVHRDVAALAEAGVPVYAERGPHGGIRLVEGYRTRLTGMTEDEAEAVFLSGVPGPAAELGLGTVVAAARLKVLAALPPELRSRAGRLTQRFHLDAPGWFQAAEPTPWLTDLAAAVWTDRRVAVRYDRGDGEVERLLEPLGLVVKGGVWYLVARAPDQVRTYRVSRVTAATVLDEGFERDERFDLAAWWAESTAAYERAVERVEATLRLHPSLLPHLVDALGPGAMAGSARVGDSDPDGWVRLRVSLEWPSDGYHPLLRLGALVEVLEPAALREVVCREARAVLERYAEPTRARHDPQPSPGTVGEEERPGPVGSAGDGGRSRA